MTGTSPAEAFAGRPCGHDFAVAAAMERWLDISRNWCLLLGLLVAVQGWLILSHQPWLDEYQALQISLQSPNLSALFENLRYEGHPPLWYLYLQTVAYIVPTAWILAVAQLPIALAIQTVMLVFTPFTRLERLLICSSVFFLFDYGTLSRSLAMGVLLLLIAFAFRHKRASWIAVVLLPLTDFLFGILSILWLVIARTERRLWLPGLIAWALSSLAAAWCVRPAPDMIPALWNNGPLAGALLYTARLSALLIPLPISEGILQWNSFLPIHFALPTGIAFLAFAWYCCRTPRLHGLLVMAFATLTAIFSVAFYPLAIRHLSLIALLVILLVWRGREMGYQEPAIFRTWLWLIAAGGLLTVAISAVKPFDTARETVAYIHANHIENKHWVVFPDSRAQGISALTGIEFERLEIGCTQSFVRWNYRTRIERASQLFATLTKLRDTYGRFYLLSDMRLPTHEAPRLIRLIHSVPAGYDGQDYHIYIVGSDRPETAVQVPKCPPERLPMPHWGGGV